MTTWRKTLLLLAFTGVIALALTACNRQPAPIKNTNTVVPLRSLPVKFTDITRAAGLKFIHNNGASGLMMMPETNGSGVAFIDYDNDGYQDLFFVNSRDWTEKEIKEAQKAFPPTSFLKEEKFAPRQTKASPSLLYHNNRNGTFSDVTLNSGLDIVMYGMGAAVGDYDNDGRPDLFVTGYPRSYLFHNEGGGKWKEVAAESGVKDDKWTMSAAWLDYDKDGLLDLFVTRYIRWTPATDIYQIIQKHKGYSNPLAYDGQTSQLYHGNGRGKFQNVTASTGIANRVTASNDIEKLEGKGMGVAVCDYNNDSWPDILVANDTLRNYLFENKQNGTFREVAVQSGIAHDQFGRPRAGMGIDTADIDHSNKDSVLIGNFSQEMLGLYYNTQTQSFVDMAPDSAIGLASRAFLTFGCLFVDYDNDGWSDIIAANGHVQPLVTQTQHEMGYAQRPLLFHNRTAEGRLHFQEVGLQSGAGANKPIVGRGLAYADIDLDGDSDLIFTSNGGPPLLLRNDGGNKNHTIRLILQGSKSNRSGIGALVKAKIGNDVLRLWTRSGSSYLSQSELPVSLGLGNQNVAEGIAILWPSGSKTMLKNIRANQILVVHEDKGLLSQHPFPRR